MTRVSPELAKSMIDKSRAISTRYEGPPIKDTCTAVPKTDRCEKVVPCAPPAHQSFEGCAPVAHPMAKARINPEKMNGEESAYAVTLMEERACSRVIDWRFQPFKLNLAPATTYTPDFLVILDDHSMEFVEVKAWWKPSKKALREDPNAKGKVGWQEDARAKTKIAASMFPWFKFVATWRRDGVWEREEIKP